MSCTSPPPSRVRICLFCKHTLHVRTEDAVVLARHGGSCSMYVFGCMSVLQPWCVSGENCLVAGIAGECLCIKFSTLCFHLFPLLYYVCV